MKTSSVPRSLPKNTSWWKTLKKNVVRDRYLLLLVLLPVLYFIIFHYVPMYGLQIDLRSGARFRPRFGREKCGQSHWGHPLCGDDVPILLFQKGYWGRDRAGGERDAGELPHRRYCRIRAGGGLHRGDGGSCGAKAPVSAFVEGINAAKISSLDILS